MRSKLIISLLIVLHAVSVHAQHINFINYSTNDGLPSSEVYEVITDQKGFLWFCSDAGIGRFSNNKIDVFTKKDGLPDNTLFHLTKFENNKLIISSYNSQFGMIDINKPFNISTRVPQLENSDKEISLILNTVVSRNVLWTNSYEGLFFAKKEDLTFKKKENKNPITIYIEDSTALLSVNSAKLAISNRTKKNTIEVVEQNKSREYSIACKKDAGYKKVLLLANGTILLISGNRMYILKSNNEVIVKEFSSIILNIYEDKQHGVWVGLRKNGVEYYKDIENMHVKETMLDGNSITSICHDEDGGIWCSSLEKGIFYSANSVYKVINNPDLKNSKIKFITSDKKNVYIVTSNNNIYQYTFDNNGSPLLQKSLQFDTKEIDKFHLVDGKIYFLVDGKFCAYDEWMNPIKINNTLICSSPKIVIGKNNKYYAYSYNSLFEIEKKPFTNPIKSSSIGKIFSIEADADSNLLVGCSNGLFRYNYASFLDLNYLHPALNNRIEQIKIDSKKRIWLCIRGNGICVIDRKKCTHYTIKDGLSSNFTTSIAIDSNVVWIGTKNGINKISLDAFNKGEFLVENIYYQDGLSNNEIKDLNIFKSHLIIATSQGLCYANLNSIRGYIPNKTSLSITPVNSSKNSDSSISYSYGEKKIQLLIESPSYRFFKNPKFIYSINNNEKNVLENTNLLTLENIKYGDYILKIKNAYTPNSKESVLYIKVKKPFWFEIWFWLLSLLILCLLLYVLYTRRIKKIKYIESEKRNVEKLIADYKLKSLKGQMNPHFLFNMLNTIYSMAIMESAKTPDIIMQLSNLLRYMIYETENKTTSIKNEIQCVEEFITLQMFRFDDRLEVRKNIHIQDEQATIAPLVLLSIIENVFKHGIGKKTSEAIIVIDIEQDANMLCLKTSNKIFTTTIYNDKYSGMGLTNIRKQLELLYKEFTLQTYMEQDFFITILKINLHTYAPN